MVPPTLFSFYSCFILTHIPVDAYKQTEHYCIFLSVFLFPLLKTQPPKPWPGSQEVRQLNKLALQLRDSGEKYSC